MDVVYRLLLVLHLLGWAIVLGGTIVTIRTPALPKGALHGILTALVTGILMVGLASSGVAGDSPDNAKMAVKLVIAVIATVLIVRLYRRPERVTRQGLGAVLGLVAANVMIAVLWQ